MDNLGGRQYFSILNQGKANHQIYLSPGSRHVTAIISYHIISYHIIYFSLYNLHILQKHANILHKYISSFK